MTLSINERRIATQVANEMHWLAGATGCYEFASRFLERVRAESKPVAWMYEHDGMVHHDGSCAALFRHTRIALSEPWNETPLFTHPAPVAVPDDQRDKLAALLRRCLVLCEEASLQYAEADRLAREIPLALKEVG